MKAEVVLSIIALFLCGCYSAKPELSYSRAFEKHCAEKCAPRAIGQLHNILGNEVCGCDVSYINKGEK